MENREIQLDLDYSKGRDSLRFSLESFFLTTPVCQILSCYFSLRENLHSLATKFQTLNLVCSYTVQDYHIFVLHFIIFIKYKGLPQKNFPSYSIRDIIKKRMYKLQWKISIIELCFLFNLTGSVSRRRTPLSCRSWSWPTIVVWATGSTWRNSEGTPSAASGR